MPEISVIVPVYRVEEFLPRCLDSICAQTICDWECILVDDGSPDRSGEICDAYALKDPRFRVVHQPNGGLSAARNAGMRVAKGNWIVFLDSDDWIHPRLLEFLHSAAVESGSSMAMCNLQTVDRWQEPPLQDKPAVSLLSGRDALCRLYTQGGGRYVVAVAKLWRREMLKALRFPVGRLHEDEATTYRLLYPLERLAEVEAPLYYYYQNPNSITHATYSPKRLDALTALEEQMDFYIARGDAPLIRQTMEGYLQKAIENVDAIRTVLQDRALASQVMGRVEDFCKKRSLRISHSHRLLLTGDTASAMKLRIAKFRDLLHEEGIGGCISYYWQKLFPKREDASSK